MGSGLYIMEQNLELLGYLVEFFASSLDIEKWLDSA